MKATQIQNKFQQTAKNFCQDENKVNFKFYGTTSNFTQRFANYKTSEEKKTKQYNWLNQIKQYEIDVPKIKQKMLQNLKNKKVKQKIKPVEKYYYITNLLKYVKEKPNNDYFQKLYIEHFEQTYYALQFAKRLEILSESLILTKKLSEVENQNKITVVFDLDETLIHCEQQEMKNNYVRNNNGKIVYLKLQGEVTELNIFVRPHVDKLLDFCTQHFELVLFTASQQEYAQRIYNLIDPDRKYFEYILYRDHCIETEDGVYIKDLRILGKDMKKVLLVDNAAYSFGYQVKQIYIQVENGIPIVPFYNNHDDVELLLLMKYLETFINCSDVRVKNSNHFRLLQLQEYQSFLEAKESFFK